MGRKLGFSAKFKRDLVNIRICHTVFNFVRGVGGDRLNFTGISNIDVLISGTNTQFRVGDGMVGNAGFGTGTLLLTTNATTGFVAADVNVNWLGATFAFSEEEISRDRFFGDSVRGDRI